jgi:hypothetical protein
MGVVSKSVWCPSGKPIDFSIFGVKNRASNNTDPNSVVVMVFFDSGTVDVYSKSNFYQWGCENV